MKCSYTAIHAEHIMLMKVIKSNVLYYLQRVPKETTPLILLHNIEISADMNKNLTQYS